MFKVLGAAIAAACLLVANPASAGRLLTFDEYNFLDYGYGGIEWQSMSLERPWAIPETLPWKSFPYIVMGGGPGITSVMRPLDGGRLAFTSGWFAAYQNDGLSLRIEGLRGDEVVYDEVFTLAHDEMTLIAPKLGDLTELRFTSFGGTPGYPNYPYDFPYFLGDDFRIAVSGIPEPATWTTLILGFGLGGAQLRRSRQEKAPLGNRGRQPAVPRFSI